MPTTGTLYPLLGPNLGAPWLARQGQPYDALLAQAALQYQQRIQAAAAAGMQQRWSGMSNPLPPAAPVAPAPPAGVDGAGGTGGASSMGGAGGAAPAGS